MPSNPNNPTAEANADRFWELSEWAPELALRMMVVRMMIEQRGFSHRTIAQHMNASREVISRATRFSMVRRPHETHRPNTMLPETVRHWLDRIEDAITEMSDAEGGVLAMQGVTNAKALADDFSHALRVALQEREGFNASHEQ